MACGTFRSWLPCVTMAQLLSVTGRGPGPDGGGSFFGVVCVVYGVVCIVRVVPVPEDVVVGNKLVMVGTRVVVTLDVSVLLLDTLVFNRT